MLRFIQHKINNAVLMVLPANAVAWSHKGYHTSESFDGGWVDTFHPWIGAPTSEAWFSDEYEYEADDSIYAAFHDEEGV